MAGEREDGMWGIFAAEPQTAPESSGTICVAAAFAIGVRRCWLGKREQDSARRALAGLDKRLTPDGFLYGIGMFAQLIAELSPPSE